MDNVTAPVQPAKPKPMKKAFFGVLFSNAVGLAAALLCLRQWGQPNSWQRLDFYSGTFLVLGALAGLASLTTFVRRGLRSKEVAKEAFGISYDPGMLRCGALLDVAGLFVILDYAHWHLMPALERPWLQSLGLAVELAGVIWLAWTDAWLARHFSNAESASGVMTGGPYRFVRHPRYLGFLLFKIAAPLIFASILGWLLWPLWVLLIRQRVRREEPHLAEMYGAAYQDYAQRTPRLFPGIW